MNVRARPDLLLDELYAFVRRYVVLSEAQAVAVSLWLVHTYCIEAAEATPYLAITSAEKRSGKSRLLEVLALLAARPLAAAGATEAALFRSLAASPPPTLLMDEVDALFGAKARGDNEDLRALLNAGYRRGTPVLRCVGEGTKQRVEPYAVFGPKALAGIGRLPDTIADRSLPIRLKRRTAEESVERLRARDARVEADPLRDQLDLLAEDCVEQLALARPELPSELDDRAQDACEPLVAIADLAGGTWPARARAALVELRGNDEDNDSSSLGIRLLADLQTIFAARGGCQIPTADLLESLCALEDAPWQELGGRRLSSRRLASLLRPYRVSPHDLRMDDDRILKGYRLDDLSDAFRRYLPQAIRDKRDIAQSVTNPGELAAATQSRVSRQEDSSTPSSWADVAHVAADAGQGPPCPFTEHRFADYTTPDGELRCGVCEPTVNGIRQAELEL
jgi:uncharacterized protein DUF3631